MTLQFTCIDDKTTDLRISSITHTSCICTYATDMSCRSRDGAAHLSNSSVLAVIQWSADRVLHCRKRNSLDFLYCYTGSRRPGPALPTKQPDWISASRSGYHLEDYLNICFEDYVIIIVDLACIPFMNHSAILNKSRSEALSVLILIQSIEKQKLKFSGNFHRNHYIIIFCLHQQAAFYWNETRVDSATFRNSALIFSSV